MRCVDHDATTQAVRSGVRVATCDACREVTFHDAAGLPADPWNALGELFADYELVGRVNSIHAPAGEVLAYRSRRQTAALRVTPPRQWFKATDGLWMCHDGKLLLMAHRSPYVSRLVGA